MKKIFPIIAMLSLIFCGCDKTKPTPVKIPINVSSQIFTKATDSGFETGDKVGIYVVNYVDGVSVPLASSDNYLNNFCYTFNGSIWVPDVEVYWKDQNTPADFYCYHPKIDNIVDANKYAFSVSTSQNDVSNYKKSDLLWGSRLGVTPTNDPIDIRVKHLMSNLVIILKPGNGYTDELLSQEAISIKIIGTKVNSIVNLASGVITTEGTAADITPLKEEKYWRALVVPQEIKESEFIKVTVGANEYSLTQSISLESGKQYTCTLTVNRISEGINIGIDGWDIDNNDYGGTLD